MSDQGLSGVQPAGGVPVAATALTENYGKIQLQKSSKSQFKAMMRKNMILKTRGDLCCCTVVELVLPTIFVALMCLPRAFIPPSEYNEEFFFKSAMDDPSWSPESGMEEGIGYKLFYTPDTPETKQITREASMRMMCESTADVQDTSGRAQSFLFQMYQGLQLFGTQRIPDYNELTVRMGDIHSACATWRSTPGDLSDEQASLFDIFIQGYPTEAAAIAQHHIHRDLNELVALATVVYSDIASDDIKYTLRGHGKQLKNEDLEKYSNKFVEIWESVSPEAAYWKHYYYFANIEHALNKAIISHKYSTPEDPVHIDVYLNLFPWMSYKRNIAGIIAGEFLALIFTLAFISSIVVLMKSMVSEKELRLREGMQIMGLKGSLYWSSWFLTHWGVLLITCFLCAAIGVYPFQYSNPGLMFLFFALWSASLIMFAYFLSCFFSRARLASNVGIVLYIGSLAPAIVVRTTNPFGNGSWTLTCLLPGSAMYWWGAVVARLEDAQLGVQSSSLSKSIAAGVDFGAGTVIGMVVLDIFLYALLTWYFDKVLPKQFGVRLPPWFFLTKSYWSGPGDEAVNVSKLKIEESENIEPLTEEEQANAAVQIHKLVKQFPGGATAVDELSLSFSKGHISALLGHNGAGKTTTISMLTGMLEPTSGVALIAGRNIRTDMLTIRKSLGVCPQFDILWPVLTVREHLALYAAFQGIPAEKIEAEINQRAIDVGLGDKIHEPVSTLSGGQKRKLSLSIAFLGSPEVVFLDEPSSGMDPYSRRICWEVIRKQKQHSAIVLTTHFMDEADALGDRIAIMSAGKLACLGSSTFLKNRYGLGYLLTLEKSNPRINSDPVATLISSHIPSAAVATNVGTEISFKLPNEHTAKFPDLLDALEASKERLGLVSYGLSCTTLEEVFLSIASGANVGKSMTSESKRIKDGVEEDKAELNPMTRVKFLQGGALKWQQFKALMMKRILHMSRDKLSVITQLLVPVLFLMASLGIASIETSEQSTYPSFILDPTMLNNEPAYIAYEAESADISNLIGEYSDIRDVKDIGVKYYSEDMRECFCPTEDQDEDIDSRRMGRGRKLQQTDSCVEVKIPGQTVKVQATCVDWIADTFEAALLENQEKRVPCNQEDGPCDGVFIDQANIADKTFEYILYINPTAVHNVPVGLGSMDSAILRSLSGGKGSITVTNHAMPEPPKGADDSTGEGETEIDLFTAIFLVMGLACLSASFSVFLVWERANNAKHLQMVSGVDKLLFWVTSYLSDILNYIVPLVLLIVVFLAFNVDAFVKGDNLSAVFMLLLLFGLSAIPCTYVLHFSFRNEMNALAALMGGYLFFGMVMLIATTILEAIDDPVCKDIFNVFKWLFRLLPHYCVGRGVYDMSVDYAKDAVRRDFPEQCQELDNLYEINGYGIRCPTSKGVWHMDVTGYHLLFMAIEAIVFFGWTLFYEYREGKSILSMITGANNNKPPPGGVEAEDEDVIAEKQRVSSGSADDDIVMVKDFSKVYSNNHYAVKPMSFGIKRGECFGLLGINGAGKTTTFKMITGEFPPTTGDCLVRGRPEKDETAPRYSVVNELNAARQIMGYCPQFDGIQGDLTAREHLRMYAMIRGVEPESIDKMVEDLLTQMDLMKYANRQAGKYSGGNKRKLSVGIALVGDPPIVLLDEPSTGMDPEARRFMWDVISNTMANRCVVLTSHSMEECEALCNNVGIMVAGQFRCLGTLQHLKNRFSEGYQLEVRGVESTLAHLIANLKKELPGSKLQEQTGTVLKVQVPASIALPQVFRVIEGLRTASPDAENKLYEDYSLSQTTLEQVFLRFASERNPDDPANQEPASAVTGEAVSTHQVTMVAPMEPSS